MYEVARSRRPGASNTTLLDKIGALDRRISAPLAPLRNLHVVKLLGGATDITKDGRWLTVCALVGGYGLVRRDANLARLGAMLLVASKTAFAGKNALKDRFDRTRPYVVDDGGRYLFVPGRDDVPALNAFPSGHSAAGILSALLVSRAYPRFGALPWRLGTAVAAIQLPRRHHYPSDVLIGAAIGFVAATLTEAAASRLEGSLPSPATSSGRAG